MSHTVNILEETISDRARENDQPTFPAATNPDQQHVARVTTRGQAKVPLSEKSLSTPTETSIPFLSTGELLEAQRNDSTLQTVIRLLNESPDRKKRRRIRYGCHPSVESEEQFNHGSKVAP